MKRILIVSILLIAFILIAPQICLCNESPPCNTSWTIIGPPVVGTWVLKYVSGEAPFITLRANFKGCCAQCFGDCKAFNVKVDTLLTDQMALPEQITEEVLLNYNVQGWGPKNCNPNVDSKDWVIETILKFDNQTDIDGDGYKDLVADVVMYYWVCNQ